MANTPNYTATKEDVRPWLTVQNTQGDALDQVALTTQAALATSTTARARFNGVTVSPATSTKAVAATQQFTAVVERGVKGLGVTWTSSNPAKATVNASTGLATGVQAGTCQIIATSIESGIQTGYADLTVT